MHFATGPPAAEAERWSGRRRASAAQLKAFGRQNWKVLTGERLSIRAFVNGSLPLSAVFGSIGPITPSDQIPPNLEDTHRGKVEFLGSRRRLSSTFGGFSALDHHRASENATLFFL